MNIDEESLMRIRGFIEKRNLDFQVVKNKYNIYLYRDNSLKRFKFSICWEDENGWFCCDNGRTTMISRDISYVCDHQKLSYSQALKKFKEYVKNTEF